MTPARKQSQTAAFSARPGRTQSLVTMGLNRLAAIALIAVVLGALFFPRGQEWVPWSMWIPLWCVLGLAGIFFATRYVSAAEPSHYRSTSMVVPTVVAIVTGILSMVVGRALSYDFGWDAGEVMRAATALSSGVDLGDYPYGYFSRYPNNIPLIGLDRLMVATSTALGIQLSTAVAVFNGVAVMTISLSVATIVRIFGSHRAALISQLLIFVFLGCSPWLAVPYTDLPVAALIAFAFATGAVSAQMQKRPWLALALALLSGVGAGAAISLKPTASILVIAIVLGSLIATVRGDRRQTVLRTGTTVAVALIIALVSGAVSPSVLGLDLERIDRSREFPMEHFARMGMIEAPGTNDSVRYGGYDVDSVEQMLNASSVDERKVLSLEAIADRLESLGPVSYASFLAKKAIWIWSDGTFGAWVEGSDESRQLFRDGPLSTRVQQVFHPLGSYWPVWSNAVTGLWLSLIAGTGAFLWRQARRGDILILSLCVLGIGAFSLLFEGRSRYLIIFVPLIVALFSILLSRSDGVEAAPRRDSHEKADVC